VHNAGEIERDERENLSEPIDAVHAGDMLVMLTYASTNAGIRGIVIRRNPVFAHRVTIPENREREHDTSSHTT